MLMDYWIYARELSLQILTQARNFILQLQKLKTFQKRTVKKLKVKQTTKDDGTIIETADCENELIQQLEKKANYAGFSAKPKKRIRNGQEADEEVVRVYVSHKLPKDTLSAQELMPEKVSLDGKEYKTDVFQLGEVVSLDLLYAQESEEHRQKQRPISPGDSHANFSRTAGTPGGIVYRDASYFLASNTHVTCEKIDADLSSQERRNCQPGPHDLPAGSNPVEYEYGIVRYAIIMPSGQTAYNDFSLNLPHSQSDIAIRRDRITPTEVIEFEVQNKVWKPSGRTLGEREGTIVDKNAIVSVNYGTEGSRTHAKCIISTALSAGGESGNWIYLIENGARTKKVGAYVFAGSTQYTIMHDLGNACYATSCEVYLEEDQPSPTEIMVNFKVVKTEDGDFKIYGKVEETGEDGNPIPVQEAEISIIQYDPESLLDDKKVFTDSKGMYEIRGLLYGFETDIGFEKEGYVAQTKCIGVVT